MVKQRMLSLDILKFMGLICIILAHSGVPKLVFQLRNFDVVLLILISCNLYFNYNSNNNYVCYIFKRFKRLILPTWIFLIVFFIIACVFDFNMSLKTIIGSFALASGIGYVWIIRIYFIIAILLPLFSFLNSKYSSATIYIVTLLIYILYELLCVNGVFNNRIIQYLFSYFIPCFSLIVVSYWLFGASSRRVFLFCIINLLIFIICGFLIYKFTGSFQTTNYMKYPFRIYYLSYGLFVSGLLIVLFRNQKITKILYTEYIKFVSNNSLWFYLWHILFIYILDILHVNMYWGIKFLLLIIFSSLLVFIQSNIVKYLESKNFNKNILNVFKG